MKKIYVLAAVLTIISSVAIAMMFDLDVSDSLFDANIEALAHSEAGASCTGPKKENLAGNIFCHCENTASCKDMYNCN